MTIWAGPMKAFQQQVTGASTLLLLDTCRMAPQHWPAAFTTDCSNMLTRCLKSLSRKGTSWDQGQTLRVSTFWGLRVGGANVLRCREATSAANS